MEALLEAMGVDEEIVVLEEFDVDTNSIKPPLLVAVDGVYETLRDLTLQATLPVVTRKKPNLSSRIHTGWRLISRSNPCTVS